MSEAPAETDPDSDSGPVIPEPPRRVPFGVVVTAILLGMLALPLALLAMVTLFSGASYGDGVGQATLRGLGAALAAVCAVLVIAVAWSFVRDGNTAGPMIVGLLVVLTGLILLVVGVAGETPDTEGLRVGVLALVLGLGVLLVPLLGHGPAYLAARRVWSRAERDWLQELTTPEAPAHPQQWPGQYPPQQQWGPVPPQQQWSGGAQGWQQPGPFPQAGYQPQPGHPAQPGHLGQPGHPGQPGYPGQPAQGGFAPQYQYPPEQAQTWTSTPPPVHQSWPEATIPPWAGEQFPATAGSAPGPDSPATSSADPAGSRPAATDDAPPSATAQQAPTELIRPTEPPPPPQ